MIVGGRTLDVPALIDLATGRTQYMRSVAYLAALHGHALVVPAVAVAQAAAAVDDSVRTELGWAVDSASVVVVTLDERSALDVGARARRDVGGDLVAAHIAEVAADRHYPIVTSEESIDRWHALGFEAEPLP